jgi:hypothetical protein
MLQLTRVRVLFVEIVLGQAQDSINFQRIDWIRTSC